MEAYGANDLFLGSADAHWFFFSSIGWLTSFFDLPTAAWIGRGIVWSLIAVGWYHLVSAVQSRPLLAPLALPPFLCAIELGHVSGEWVVGGFEAKGIAYALIFLGLGDALRWRWDRCWWWMGLASAFHVVVGAWVTLTLLITMVVLEGRQAFRLQLWTKQFFALVGGGCLALAGLIPALQLNLHVPKEIAARAAKIYVYDRLPHHLSPLHFAWDRWLQHSVWLLLVVALFLLFAASAFSTQPPTAPELERSDPSKENQSNLWRSPLEGSTVAVGSQVRLVWIIALIAALFAVVAIGIDMLGVRKPEWAAGLLRFYWFRWNDVSWPLAVTLTLLTYRFVPVGHPRLLRALALFLLTVPSSLWLADRFLMQWEQVIPEADVRSLLMENESPEQELATYRDWLAVCAWIREETPEDSLWLTPRYQQTFPWYALRAEVVNWKIFRKMLRKSSNGLSACAMFIATPRKAVLSLPVPAGYND